MTPRRTIEEILSIVCMGLIITLILCVLIYGLQIIVGIMITLSMGG